MSITEIILIVAFAIGGLTYIIVSEVKKTKKKKQDQIEKDKNNE